MSTKKLITKVIKRDTFIREVAAMSAEEALNQLNEMSNSCFDMAVMDMTVFEDKPDYIRLKVFGWENAQTREYYSC